MFKKKKDPELSELRQKTLREIDTLMLMNSFNESNKRLGKIDNSEYEATKNYIIQKCNELEARLSFDDQMGSPMEQLEEMMFRD